MSNINEIVNEKLVTDVLVFWFGEHPLTSIPEESIRKSWFVSTRENDLAISNKFKSSIEALFSLDNAAFSNQELANVNHSRLLATIILLDQFTRNVYRGEAAAFSGDQKAILISGHLFERAEWTQFHPYECAFALMPHCHSEELNKQEICQQQLELLCSRFPKEEGLKGFLSSAIEHQDIIRKFGRFPHRNEILDRTHTAEEKIFLIDGPTFGQSKK